MQDFAVEMDPAELGPKRVASLHCVVAMFMNFGAKCSENSVFEEAVSKVRRPENIHVTFECLEC